MFTVDLPVRGTFETWREAARRLASNHVAPPEVGWTVGKEHVSLFDSQSLPGTGALDLKVPNAFMDLAKTVLLSRDEAAPALLYEALVTLQARPRLLSDLADPTVRRLNLIEKSVRRDIHKMRAFVRFRELPSNGPRRSFAAWFEPEHRIAEANSGFFRRRFADMDWAIHTPDLAVIYRDGELSFAEGSARPDLPDDAAEELWATYFANIFNPARIKLASMRQHMPLKYWKNMPETGQIPAMLAAAESRVEAMRKAAATPAPARAAAISDRYRAAMPKAPEKIMTLDDARAGCAQCQRCDLYQHATQAVFGEGPANAALMIVGEQPGDQEDLQGRPFVGPAGQVLDGVMDQVGLDRRKVWMTNAVKHFKFIPRGKRRLHQRPNAQEVTACKWWLDLERQLIAPQMTVAMGATAATALTGRGAALTKRRGRVEETELGPVLLTWHPSAILRQPDPGRSAEMRAQLAEDLRAAAAAVDL